ncbi:unnamed protein product [Vitrella brassicaformis CCMP3155]|uniref:Uncharacterized protein n=1 Tax=Vitrella brassicaformis (strain CCMP3155) TaxID=1169540 RepID=A0A0G4FR27_VITBC|nr:unnamed protein product [Vitrella brassicaformis CCMP3155]|eukprot:CEM16910.1 unnamed protein product [Vitrella brassicaformis CCMP3155]
MTTDGRFYLLVSPDGHIGPGPCAQRRYLRSSDISKIIAFDDNDQSKPDRPIGVLQGASVFFEKCIKLLESEFRDDSVLAPSGVRYKIIQQGSGAMPTAEQQVKFDYIEWGDAWEGEVCADEPGSTCRPAELPGWFGEAITSMRVGEVRRLMVPPDVSHAPVPHTKLVQLTLHAIM